MPGPTTERLDEDVRSLRDDMQDIKVLLARMDAKLAELETQRVDVKSNAISVAKLDERLSRLVGVGKWLGSIFALAAVYGVFNVWGRLGIVESQLKNVDNRLGVVEIQLKNMDAQLGEVKGALSRRPIEPIAELVERINRIARTAVDDAIKQAALPKPSP